MYDASTCKLPLLNKHDEAMTPLAHKISHRLPVHGSLAVERSTGALEHAALGVACFDPKNIVEPHQTSGAALQMG